LQKNERMQPLVRNENRNEGIASDIFSLSHPHLHGKKWKLKTGFETGNEIIAHLALLSFCLQMIFTLMDSLIMTCDRRKCSAPLLLLFRDR